MRLLLVDGKAAPSVSLIAELQAQGCSIEFTNTGTDALDLLRHYEFDLVLLQFVLPDMDGVTFLTRMRGAGHSTAAMALNTVAQTRYRAKALAAGADDVVEHGIDLAELLARMRAIVRRSRGHSHSRIQVGSLTLDIDQQLAMVNAKPVFLTPKEFAILQLLMLRKNTVMTKDAILTNIYGGMDEPEIKIVDVFICKLRKKLAQAGADNIISTVWGRGYAVHDHGRHNTEITQPVLPTQAKKNEIAYA